MGKDIFIKQSDLINDSMAINYRYRDRLNFLHQNIFNKDNLDDFYVAFQNFRFKTKNSPLGKKLNLIQDFVVSYLFIKYELSISGIADQLNISIGEVAWSLLSFFSNIYNDKVKLNNYFQVDEQSTIENDKCLKDLRENFNENRAADALYHGVSKVDLSYLLETPGWENVLENKSSFYSRIKSQPNNLRINLSKMIFSYVLLIALMSLILFVTLQVNRYNENKLLTKVNVPSRFFTWLDLDEFNPLGLISSINDDGEKKFMIADETNFEVEEFGLEEDRFDVESDVLLTSLGELYADELNTLEEENKGGFRDTRFGNNKVYRVMVASSDIIAISKQMEVIMSKYGVAKGGNVEAGSQLPGGLYYNLLVPTPSLKNFFSDIEKNEDLTIYLSKSKMSSPKGKSNVFIWVKKI